jgi:hypothetical protein
MGQNIFVKRDGTYPHFDAKQIRRGDATACLAAFIRISESTDCFSVNHRTLPSCRCGSTLLVASYFARRETANRCCDDLRRPLVLFSRIPSSQPAAIAQTCEPGKEFPSVPQQSSKLIPLGGTKVLAGAARFQEPCNGLAVSFDGIEQDHILAWGQHRVRMRLGFRRHFCTE